MPTLLRIDSSARNQGSHSRLLADEFESRWLAAHPDGQVQRRDLAERPIASIENNTIVAYYTPDEALTDQLRQATAQSDELIAELMAADAILISCPMYNFTIPAVLKAWIDQVVRVRKTYRFTEDGNMQGLVKGKPAYITTALGAQFTDTALATMDHLHPYMKTVLGFIGFEQIEIFSLESTAVDEKQYAINKNNMLQAMDRLFAKAVA